MSGSTAISRTFLEAAQQGKAAAEELLRLGDSPLDWIDRLRRLQTTFAETSDQKTQRACGAGCSACCFTVQADVTGIEAIAVAEYLRDFQTPETMRTTVGRLARITQKRKEMIAARQVRPLACGMLAADGTCQIYPVRPIVCSGVYSLDRQSCEDGAEKANAGSDARVPLDQTALQATGGISGALQRVLVEHNLDGNLYELNSAVLCAVSIEDPLRRFLQREDIFSSAICTEAHSPPRLGKLKGPHFLKRQSRRPA